MRRIAATLLCFLLAASAQQPPQEGMTKFSSSSQLVVEIVTVHDRNGKTIDGLTAKDFTITENGAAQTIKFCDFQTLAEVPDTPSAAAPAPRPPAAVPAAPAVTQAQIAPEAPGD